jgi:hypothetical protein
VLLLQPALAELRENLPQEVVRYMAELPAEHIALRV